MRPWIFWFSSGWTIFTCPFFAGLQKYFSHLILDFLLEFWINSPRRPVYVQIHLGTAGKHLEKSLGAAFQSRASVLFSSREAWSLFSPHSWLSNTSYQHMFATLHFLTPPHSSPPLHSQLLLKINFLLIAPLKAKFSVSHPYTAAGPLCWRKLI